MHEPAACRLFMPFRRLICGALCTMLVITSFSVKCFALNENSKTTTANISVSAQSAILYNAGDGGAGVLWEKNAHRRLPMASTTKIMTAMIAIEALPLDTVVTVPAEAVGVEGSSIYLCEGERQTLEALLFALLLESANDAATAIAVAVAGSTEAFADMMNRRAESLGLCDTHFVNPHGLDDDMHYTTAYDLAVTTAAAFSLPDFRRITGTYRVSVPFNDEADARLLINHNKLLRTYPGAIGGKTGYTKKSGRCLVSAAERDGLCLIAVTLSDPNDWADHEALLDFGFSEYESIRICDVAEYEFAISVSGGEQNSVLAANKSAIRVTLPRSHGEITMSRAVLGVAAAPIKQGDVLGSLSWTCDGSVIASADICAEFNAAAAVQQKKFDPIAWLLSLLGIKKT